MKKILLSALIANAVAHRLGYSSDYTAAVMAGFLGCMDLSFTTRAWAAIEGRRV